MKYPTTNKSLLEKVQDGDEVSWNDFYGRYAPIVRYLARRAFVDAAEIDDVIQEVMQKFFQNSRTYVYRDGKVKFRTYFQCIVRSVIIDHQRRNRRFETEPLLEDQVIDESQSLERDFMEEWRKAALAEAMAELRTRVDARNYQAFEMFGLQHREMTQVKAILSMTENQIYLAKSRCTKILQEIVKRMNNADDELKLEAKCTN